MSITRTLILFVTLALPAFPASSFQVPTEYTVTAVDLQTTSITYDPIRRVLLASVPNTVEGGLANTIARIDPNTGSLLGSVFLGSNPGQIRVAPDGTTAYVGMLGELTIKRYDLSTNSVVGTIAIPSDPFRGPLYAEDIAIAPSNSASIVVTLRDASRSHAGVVAYNNGAVLPQRVDRFDGSNRIEFVGGSTTLYGLSEVSTQVRVQRLELTPNGVREVEVFAETAFALGKDFVVSGNQLYFSGGKIYDTSFNYVVGTLSPATAQFNPYLLDVEPATAGIAYGVEGGINDPLKLVIYDTATFTPLQTYALPGVSVFGADIVSLDNGTLALQTTGLFDTDPKLYLLAPIPEPSTISISLVGIAMIALQLFRRRRS